MALTRFQRNTVLAASAATFIGTFEGLRTAAYLDPVGIPTICFGSTKGVKLGDKKTVAECKALLTQEIIDHERGVRICLRNPDALPEGLYIAMNSLAFNIGVGNFCGSSAARRTNAGDYPGACQSITLWDKARYMGILIRLPGLVKRREAERVLCLGSLST